MSNLTDHARRELAFLLDSDDEMDKEMGACVLRLIEVFAEQGHSGFSATYCVGLTEKLMRFEPLGPLTGADDEWCVLDYAPDTAAQNKRCGRVFKRSDGTAYDIEGRIFRDPDGSYYTNSESRVEVTFPYTPTRVYVDRSTP